MKPAILIAAVLCLGLAACTPSEEPTTGTAPEPLAEPAAVAKENADAGKAFAAAGEAFAAAEKACRGCPNVVLCQEALGTSLRMTTQALQIPVPDAGLEQAAQRADVLEKQFGGLAELSNECLKEGAS